MSVEDLQRQYFQAAMGMDISELKALSNGQSIPGKPRIPAVIAVMALQLKKPMIDAMRGQQAAQEPKKPTVKDQIVSDAMDAGLGGANSGNLMDEKTLAAGGIVAFEEGGLTQDITAQIAELRRRRSMLAAETGRVSPTVSARGVPAVSAGLGSTQANVEKIKQLRDLDTQIAQLESKFKTAQGREQTYLAERAAEMAPGIGFQAPAGLGQEQQAQQGQQPPGAAQLPPAYTPSSLYPRFQKLGDEAVSDINKIDIGSIATKAAEDPRLSGLFGLNRQQYLDQFKDERAELEKTLPESEAAALKKIQEREAGLEAISAKREQRAAEAYKRAEKESSMGKGEALLGIAAALISTPVTSRDFQQHVNNFTGQLGAVRKDLSKAASERDKALDLIEESKELRKIGQLEKAEAKFLEGRQRLFNFDMTLKQGAIAADTARNTNVLSYADKQANKDIRAIEAKLGVLTAGLKEEGATDRARLEAASAERRANIIYGGAGAGGSKEIDRARDNAARDLKAWAETNKTLLLTDPNAYDRKKQELLRAEFKSLGYTDTQVNAMLGAGSSGGAPTGQKVLKFGDI